MTLSVRSFAFIFLTFFAALFAGVAAAQYQPQVGQAAGAMGGGRQPFPGGLPR